MGLTVRGQAAGEPRATPQVVDSSKEDWFIRSARHWGRENRWLYHRAHRIACELAELDEWLADNVHKGTYSWEDFEPGDKTIRTIDRQYWRRNTRALSLMTKRRVIWEEMERVQALAQGLAKGKPPALAEAMRAAWLSEKMAELPPDRRPSKEPIR